MPIFVKELAGRVRVLADWPQSGAGNFDLTLAFRDGSWTEQRILCCRATETEPRWLWRRCWTDLQQRLPASIAIALQRAGALSGIEIVAPEETTLAEELHRLTRAARGTPTRAGLVDVLRLLAEQPHQVLRGYEEWRHRERARRIDAARLPQAFNRAGNLDRDRLPTLVPERPVVHVTDTYENRLVEAFYRQVNLRLRLLLAALQQRRYLSLAEEAAEVLGRLDVARRVASFLDDVSDLAEAPGRVTMVLLKRPEYRAALEGFLEFRRRALVRISEPSIDAPLENLPFLYETWGVLEVIAVLLDLAADLGYQVRLQRICSRRAGHLWIQVLRDGQAALVLSHPQLDRTIAMIPQRSYSPGAENLHSVSFLQRPDIAVEITENDRTDVYVFDPKYKLESEEEDVEDASGRPKKIDIDAMHSYRDAIRGKAGERVVRYAAILYPGPATLYTPGLAALNADPRDSQSLKECIRNALLPALSPHPTKARESALTTSL